jgi:hypothetical protein
MYLGKIQLKTKKTPYDENLTLCQSWCACGLGPNLDCCYFIYVSCDLPPSPKVLKFQNLAMSMHIFNATLRKTLGVVTLQK